MTGIGHNQGPSMEPGLSWRRHAWGKARARLLPVLPIEVLRTRVRRAAQIGLDYRTYASIRASTGHDVIGFLFSTNALRMLAPRPDLPGDRRAALQAISGAGRVALARAPLTVAGVLEAAGGALDAAHPAPRPFAPWAETRLQVLQALSGPHWQADRVVMVGDMTDEEGWAQAAKLAWYLPADRYFAA